MANHAADEPALISRPQEAPPVAFQFGVAKPIAIKNNSRQTFKPWDFSQASALLDAGPSVVPLFGSRADIHESNIELQRDPAITASSRENKAKDLSNLKIPISDFPESCDESKNQNTSIQSLPELSTNSGEHINGRREHFFALPTISPRPRQSFRPTGQGTQVGDTRPARLTEEARKEATPPQFIAERKKSSPEVPVEVDTSWHKNSPEVSSIEPVNALAPRDLLQCDPERNSLRDQGANHLKPPEKATRPAMQTTQTSRKRTSTQEPRVRQKKVLAAKTTDNWITGESWNDTSISIEQPQPPAKLHLPVLPSKSGMKEGPANWTTSHKVSNQPADPVTHARQVTDHPEQTVCDPVYPPTKTGISNSRDRRSSSRAIVREKMNIQSSATDNRSSVTATDQELPEMKLVVEIQRLRYHTTELENKLGQKEEEFQRAYNETEDERTRCSALTQRLEQKSLELDRLQNKQGDYRNKVERLKKMHDAAEKTINSAQDSSHDLFTRIRLFGTTLETLGNDVNDIREVATSSLSSLQDGADNNAKLMKLLKQLQNDNDAERLHRANLQAVCDRNSGAMSEDRDRIVDMSKQISTLLSTQELTVQQHIAELSERDKQTWELSHQLKEMRENLQNCQSTLLNKMSETLGMIKNESMLQTDNLRAEITKLENQANEQRRINQDAQLELASQLVQLQQISSDRDTKALELEHITHMLTESQAEVSKLKAVMHNEAERFQGLEAQHQAKFVRCQQEWEEINQAETAKLLGECDRLRKESSERAKKVEELEQVESNLKAKVEAAECRCSNLETQNSRIQDTLRAEFEEHRAVHERQVQRSKEQDVMHYENQLKSQDSKIVRLERDAVQLQARAKVAEELEGAHSALVTEAKQRLIEIEGLRRENRAVQELRAEQQRNATARVLLEVEVESLKQSSDQHEGLKKLHVALERSQKEALSTIDALKEELQKYKDAEAAEAQILKSHNHVKASQPIPTHVKSMAAQKVGTTVGRTQFANINRSSDSLDDLDDFDFIHDTPPKLPATVPNIPKKGKDKDKKRRSLPVETVKNTQEEPNESFLQSNAVDGGRLHQLREEKTTRSRSSTRNAQKKRKSG